MRAAGTGTHPESSGHLPPVPPGGTRGGDPLPGTGIPPATSTGTFHDWGLSTRPWTLDEPERRELLRALRFDWFKWDTWSAGRFTMLPEILVVPEALHRRVVHAVEALSAGLARLEARLHADSEALTRLGIPPRLHPLLAEEPEQVLQCARYDLFPCEDGRLMVSEFNEDVPGGFNETVGLPHLLGDPGPGARWEAGFREAMVQAFDDADSVALLYATAFSEDLQHMLILDRWLTDTGHRTVRGSPAHLRRGWFGGARVLGTPIDAAFRFYPGEWMPRLPNYATWRRLNPHLPMMNPLRHMVRQSKKVFDLWWEVGAPDPETRALLEAHAPRTFPFDPSRIEGLVAEREQWVLKRAFGRMGDAVIMGSLVDERSWREALREAARKPRDWCIQACFRVSPLAFAEGLLYPTLGAFVVNGRFAGYYSRAAARPFLTHEALHVATVVQVS
jgi:glutathionylspermidine synthase